MTKIKGAITFKVSFDDQTLSQGFLNQLELEAICAEQVLAYTYSCKTHKIPRNPKFKVEITNKNLHTYSEN